MVQQGMRQCNCLGKLPDDNGRFTNADKNANVWVDGNTEISVEKTSKRILNIQKSFEGIFLSFFSTLRYICFNFFKWRFKGKKNNFHKIHLIRCNVGERVEGIKAVIFLEVKLWGRHIRIFAAGGILSCHFWSSVTHCDTRGRWCMWYPAMLHTALCDILRCTIHCLEFTLYYKTAFDLALKI